MIDKKKIHQILSSLWKNDDSVGKTYYNQALQDVQTVIDLQEESKVCMYSTANYTNADRLTLCKDCEELCKYNQKTAAERLGISQEAYDEIVDKCLYGSEVELVDDGDLPKEEPVSEDLEKEIERWAETFKHNPAVMGYKETAQHFANWQKKKDQEIIETAIHHAYHNGKLEMKEQLMAKAVNGFVIEDIEEGNGDFLLSADYLSKDMGLKDRQKVKVIVIKED